MDGAKPRPTRRVNNNNNNTNICNARSVSKHTESEAQKGFYGRPME